MSLGEARLHARGDHQIGAEHQPDFLTDKPYIRATQVCLKEPDGWRVMHAHFSSGRRGKRPDQGGPE